MKRLVVLGCLAGVFAGCNPDIPNTPSSTYVTALFDPANGVAPSPNVLATDMRTGLLAVPIPPGASPAQAEFTTDFLNKLDGYPRDTPARATFDGDLVPTSVNASSVKILDLAAGGAPVAGTAASYVAAQKQIVIPPPANGWPNGHVIAVVLIAGPNGLQSANGVPVVGSPTWALVRSKTPLVTCTTLFQPDGSINPDCQPTVTVIPSNEHDPAARLQDQTRSAVQLEQIRRSFVTVLDNFEAQGVPRENIPLAWLFKVTTRPDVTFDPANNIVPFPNDLLLNRLADGGTQVNLPIPDGGSPAIVQLYTGLNTLDGFSTTAPLVSVFNADTLGPLNQGTIDGGSLATGAGVALLRPPTNPVHPPTAPSVKACIDCASSLLPDGGTPNHPPRLQFVPNVPLDERTTYGAFVTTNVTDTTGKRVIPATTFALLRSANPLFDGTKSTIDLISDAQAQQLEPARAALKPLIDAVATQLPGGRSDIALAWAFTTQSEVSGLRRLRGVPQALPATTLFLQDVTSTLRPSCPTGCPDVDILIGEFTSGNLLTGPGGVFNPTGVPTLIKVPFLLTVPTAGSGPYPVTVFGHGLSRARTDLLAIANTLGLAGEAAIATDVVFHGDRTTCTGSRAVTGQPSDDASCANPTIQMCASTGRCILQDRTNPLLRPCTFDQPNADLTCISFGQGFCHTDNLCEAGDYSRDSTNVPLISGWNFLNLTNLFATRDNFRQQVIDLTQSTRVIAASGNGSLNALLSAALGKTLSPDKINYAGQSLGGIIGTLYTSVASEAHNVVLNVPGGDPTNILLTSPDPQLSAARTAFLATLAGQGITQGSIAFDTFIGTARWILDPADPQNMAFSVLHGGDVPNNRKALISYITQDQVVPNPTTVELLNAGNRIGISGPFDVCLFNPSTTDLPQASRHGFLLNFVDVPVTAAAQSQLAGYVATGMLTGCP